MSINWPLIESNPSKKQKIEGNALLELREKTYDLEKQLSATKTELEKNKNELHETKEKLSSTEKNLNTLKEEKTGADKKISELESDLQSTKDKNSSFENQLKEASEKNSSKDKEIQKLKENFEEKSNQVNEFNHRIKTLMSEIAVGETYQNIQKMIQEVVNHKGFIMDKEIEQIMDEEIEK